MTETAATGKAYYAAKEAMFDLLETSPEPWMDVLVLVRTLARERRADLMEQALVLANGALNHAARQQDILDASTSNVAPEDAELDRRVVEEFRA